MPEDERRLDSISTLWPEIHDASNFVLRYGPAIRAYLEAILHVPDDVEEAMQEFLVRVVEHRFERVTPDRGRFRDYLKRAVRNAAVSRIRKRRTRSTGGDGVDALAAPESASEPDARWRDAWRRCVLEGAWRATERHERSSPGNLFHTVLTLVTEHSEEDSAALAARAGDRRGEAISPVAFRKQLSRARKFFAERIAAEVARTLQQPTPARVEEELADLGLLEIVREHLAE